MKDRFIKTDEGVWLNLDHVKMLYISERVDGTFGAIAEMAGSDRRYHFEGVFDSKEKAQGNLATLVLGV